MPRNIVDDIITKKKKGIRQIPIPKGRKFFNAVENDGEVANACDAIGQHVNVKVVSKKEREEVSINDDIVLESESNEVESNYDYLKKFPERNPYHNDDAVNKVSGTRIFLWSAAALAILLAIVSVFSVFSHATLTLYPKTVTISLEEELNLKKVPTATDVGFETVAFNKKASKTIEATQDEKTEKKASGVITIYNNFTTTPQKFIENTRFEGANGLIYRIKTAVNVPGKKTVAGKVVPGSVDATIFADQAGDQYNIKIADLTGDFKVPGLKGSPRYDKFFARIKTDIAGGFVGVMKKISPDVQAKVETELQQELKKETLAALYASKPENFVLFEGMSFWNFSTEVGSTTSTTADIKMTADYHAVLINTQKLARYLAENKVSDYENNPVDLSWKDDTFKVTLNDKKITTQKPWELDTLPVLLSGSAKIVWMFDSAKLQEAIAGVSKQVIKEKITSLANISKAEVVVRPFWKTYLPSDPKNITIKRVIPD
ncbi:MAG: hypothetical protein WCF94_04270 [bacterium]